MTLWVLVMAATAATLTTHSRGQQDVWMSGDGRIFDFEPADEALEPSKAPKKSPLFLPVNQDQCPEVGKRFSERYERRICFWDLPEVIPRRLFTTVAAHIDSRPQSVASRVLQRFSFPSKGPGYVKTLVVANLAGGLGGLCTSDGCKPLGFTEIYFPDVVAKIFAYILSYECTKPSRLSFFPWIIKSL